MQNLAPLVPHDYQAEAIEVVLRDKHTLVKAGTGSGKTLVGVEAVLRSEAKVTAIIAPINTFTGWRKTFARQTGGTVEVRYIDARKEGKKAHEDLANAVPGVYFVGVERMRKQAWRGWKLDFVIWDEIHRGANRKSATHLMAMTMKPEYALGLSATPWGNKVEGAWAIGRWLWGAKVDRSFHRFATTYLYSGYDPEVPHSKYKYLGEVVPGSIIRDFPSVVQMPNAYNEKPVIHEVEVVLNPTQRKYYAEMEETAIAWLEANPLVAALPSTKYIRLMEMTLASPSVKQGWVRKKNADTDEWEDVWGDIVYFEDNAKSSKADAVLEIIDDIQAERKEPVLIFTHSRKFATFLAKRLQSKGHNARQFIGGMGKDERDWKLENFGTEYDILVAVVSTLAEGVDSLTEYCANEIWCSVSDSKIINFQAAGRLSRQGQTRTVNRWVLQAGDTIEVTKQKGRLVYDQSLLDESYGDKELSA